MVFKKNVTCSILQKEKQTPIFYLFASLDNCKATKENTVLKLLLCVLLKPS